MTRVGYSRTPANTASLPIVSDSVTTASPVTSRRKRSNSARASLSVLPFTASVISDAEAFEMAQPDPRKLTSLMTPPSRLT